MSRVLRSPATVVALMLLLIIGTVIAMPASVHASTHTNTQIWGQFELNNGGVTMWLKICGAGAHYRFRSVRATNGQVLWDQTYGAVTTCTASYRAVIGAKQGEQIRFYSMVLDGASIGDGEFLQRANRQLCTVTNYNAGTISCSAETATAPAADINTPTNGASVQNSVLVQGWAIDAAAMSSTGINQVDVHLIKDGTDSFLGTASYGASRSDVASAYGDARFTNSGYSLSFDSNSFANGVYTLQIGARSTQNGQWTSYNRQLTIANNVAPNVPTMISPANGGSIVGNSVTLIWADTGDPDNGPRTYRDYSVEIRKADNSWNTAWGWNTATSWALTVPSAGQYLWRVQSGDGARGSGWSAEWSFTVQDPPTPTPLPTATATPVPTDTPTATATATAVPTEAPTATATATEAPTATAGPTDVPGTPGPTAVPTPSATPLPGRETRTVGVITITADSFTDLGSGQTEARGNIWLGEHLLLTGSLDSVKFDTTQVMIDGTLAWRAGGALIFTGKLAAVPATAIATPQTGGTSPLAQIGGFSTASTVSITAVNLVAGTVDGTSSLNLNIRSAQAAATIQFTLRPGPYASATLAAFSMSIAGVTLQAPAGALLSDGVISVPSVTLITPTQFGGASATINGLRITPDSITLGSGTVAFGIPDLRFGDGSRLALTKNKALLSFDLPQQRYKLSIDSSLALRLPDNDQVLLLTVTLASVQGQPQLSATLNRLTLNLGGASLAMSALKLDNQGLQVGSGTLTLPAKLGGTVTLSNLRVSASGLSIDTGSFSLPTIVFGGDNGQLKVSGVTASLQTSNGRYLLAGQGTLQLRLPDNSQDIHISFTIKDATFAASLGQLTLKVAGANFFLETITINNTGLHIGKATITLPSSLGSASGAVTAVSITKDGLRIGGASFALPTVAIGDGSKVKISAVQVSLTIASSHYVLQAKGTLNLNLPGNSQNIAINFSLDSGGAMKGTLSSLQLQLAGASLRMTNLTVSNSGLSVTAATLTLPTALGSGAVTLQNVKIGAGGLSIGSGTIALPDIKIGSGTTVKIVRLTAQIGTAGGGYTLTIRGQLQIRLPQNSQNIDITGSINTNGHISATISQITLALATVNLKLNNIALSNSGLSVASGTLNLPGALGGTSGSVSNVTIDNGGLHIGGAGLTFNFPNFRIGSGSGFSVTNVRATVQIAADQSYKLTLAGTVQVSIPGSSVSAGGSITVDKSGAIRGTMNEFALTVAGLELRIKGATIAGDTLSVSSAGLKIPAAWGGMAASVSNVRVSPSGISIGGGTFSVPEIKAGGFTLGGISGSLQRVGNGYEISADGQFRVPGLGSSGSCGIKVGLTIAYTNGALAVSIAPPAEAAPGSETPGSFNAILGLALRSVRLGLYGCQIPIGTTGFALTRVEGSVTLSAGSTQVKVGVSVETSALRVAGKAALRGDLDMGMVTKPAEFSLSGTLYVFVFKASQLNVRINEADGFRGSLWIEAVVARGNFNVHAWSRYGKFHLTGSARVEVGIPKGKIFSAWGFNVPPSDWNFGNINAEFGEFRNGAYGFKGWVSLMGYNAGFFVDNSGRLTIGNVDQYRLVDSLAIRRAILAAQQRQAAGLAPRSTDGISVADAANVIVSVPITVTSDTIFGISGDSASPALSLVTPNGVAITPANLPPNVRYLQTTDIVTATGETITQTLYIVHQAALGTWGMSLTGPTTGTYALVTLGSNPAPVLTNVTVNPAEQDTATVNWRMTSDEPTTMINLYVTSGPITATQVVTDSNGIPSTIVDPLYSGSAVAQNLLVDQPGWITQAPYSHTINLATMESGTYWIWAEADDGRNAPVRVFAPTPLVVDHSASWAASWAASVNIQPAYRQLHVEWQPSPHPDVDGYRVTAETAGMPTTSITVGTTLVVDLETLEAGRPYTVTVEAYDEQRGLIMRGASVTATPAVADWTLALSASSLSLASGGQGTISVLVSTPMAVYPDTLGLSSGLLTDGIDLQFETTVVTPTSAGIVVSALISASDTLPSGVYPVPISVSGGGITHEQVLMVTVSQPAMSVIPSPANIVMHTGDVQSLTLTVGALENTSAPLEMTMIAPEGLVWAGGQLPVPPGDATTFVLTDTDLLVAGSYQLLVVSSQGLRTLTTTIPLQVLKPDFTIHAVESSQTLVVSGTAVWALDIVTTDGWSTPISLTIDPASLPPNANAWFVTEPGLFSSSNTTSAPLDSRVYLMVQVGDNAPAATYTLRVQGESNGRQSSASLELELLAQSWRVVLPLIRR